MKKFIKTFLVMATMLCFMASVAFAAPKDELDALLKDMNKVNNGKIDLVITGKFLEDTFNIVSKLDFESKPNTLIRGETEMIVLDGGNKNKAKKTAYEFYLEDNDKEYVYYYTEKGKNKWYKDSISNDDKKTEKDAMEIAASQIDEKTLEEMTGKVDYDADFMGQSGKTDLTGYKVTMDVGKLMEIISAVAIEGAKKDEAESIKAFADVAKDLPPMSYTIVGDNKNREIVAVKMPLTEFLNGCCQTVANNKTIEPMTKLLAVMALSGAELEINAEGKDYNKVTVKKLDDNTKRNAKQVEENKSKK